MNGLEPARGYYEEFGKPMLETDFADILPLLAVGFVGSGSEHYGFEQRSNFNNRRKGSEKPRYWLQRCGASADIPFLIILFYFSVERYTCR